MLRTSFITALAAAMLSTGFGPVAPAAAQAQSQDNLRAAIVVNILRLTEFRRAPEGGRRVLCVAQGAYSPALAALDGQAIGSARLAIRRVGSDFAGCDALYTGSDRPPATNLLTIGDSSDFVARGGVVGLVRFGREIRFEISPGAGQRAGVSFSSRLLRLAIIRRS